MASVTPIANCPLQIMWISSMPLHGTAGVDRIHGRLVGTALVHRDFVWMAIQSHGLIEEAFCRSHVPLCHQQEVDGLAMLVDGGRGIANLRGRAVTPRACT